MNEIKRDFGFDWLPKKNAFNVNLAFLKFECSKYTSYISRNFSLFTTSSPVHVQPHWGTEFRARDFTLAGYDFLDLSDQNPNFGIRYSSFVSYRNGLKFDQKHSHCEAICIPLVGSRIILPTFLNMCGWLFYRLLHNFSVLWGLSLLIGWRKFARCLFIFRSVPLLIVAFLPNMIIV